MSSPNPPIRIAISACLLGHQVRFNGGHKASNLCMEVLAPYFEFIPVCPEMAIGLGTPREPIRLVGDPAQPRAIGTKDASRDLTAPLAAYGQQMAQELSSINGYILMQKSPSCGMERVKVYQDNGYPAGSGAGVYAQVFMQACPDIPVEEDGRLNDPVLRENFLVRVFAHARWQALQREGLTRQGVLDFHACYKYQLLAHDPVNYKRLGRLLADMGRAPLETLAADYFRQLMQALKKPATRGTHTNALQHMAGYLKKVLDAADRQELHQIITQYRTGMIPLIVPLTLLRHYLRKHPDPYLLNQAYWQPYPEALSLRNAI